jgi:beta-N-acetylhexosaminidase
MSQISEAIESLGECLIVGFQGLDLSEETAAFFSQAKIGATILFSHNYESPAQVADLISQVQECKSEFPLWISVDQEGGKVQRFKKGFSRIPEAATIGAKNSPKLTFEIASIIASELAAVGVNLNFCPIADIATNPKNPVIGNRSFGRTAADVSKMVTAMVRGHLLNGVQPCLKHFPGHGDTNVDSHFALPRVDTPLEVLEEREFIPFQKGTKSHCSFIMSAHIVNPTLDPLVPATLSAPTLQGILRQKLRYQKIIVSDDMEMKAIAGHFGAEEAPRMALQAGCDMLIYRSETAGRIAYEALVRALEDGKLDPARVLEASSRSRSLKKEALKHYHPLPVAEVTKKLNLPEFQAILAQFA